MSELIIVLVEYLPESENKASVVKSAKANIKHHQAGIAMLLGACSDEANESHEWN
jgi:hypothetical protein